MASSLSTNLKPFMGFPSSRLELPKISPPSVRISFRTYVISGLKVAAGFASNDNFHAITDAYGCRVLGCPPRVPLSNYDLQMDLDRWRSDESIITRRTMENDTCRIFSGIYEGRTDGSLICVFVSYADQRAHRRINFMAFHEMSIDPISSFKYGIRSIQNRGIVFPTETNGRVVAGAIAKKILRTFWGVEVLAYVSQVDDITLPDGLIDHQSLNSKLIDASIIRCPNLEYSAKMISSIDTLRLRGNSASGVVTCIVRKASRGVNLPISDKVERKLAKALFDYLRKRVTNLVGVSKGGISNGETINLRIEFMPPTTIRKYHRKLALRNMDETELISRGQVDPCVAPKVVPLVEAVVALALAEELIS